MLAVWSPAQHSAGFIPTPVIATLVHPLSRATSSPLGRSVTTLSLMKTSGAYGFVSPRK